MLRNDLLKKIDELKKKKKDVLTNVLGFPQEQEKFQVFQSLESIVFFQEQGTIIYLHFVSLNAEDLAELLKKIPRECCVHIFSKTKGLYSDILLEGGFEKYATLRRGLASELEDILEDISTKEKKLIRRLYDDNYGTYASLSNIDQVYTMIHQHFDARSDYLDDYDSLKRRIQNKEIFVHYEGDTLSSLLVWNIQGGIMNIEIGINEGVALGMHHMHRKVYEIALAHGCKYVQTWISEENERSIRFNEFYGIFLKDLYKEVYCKEIKE